MKKSMIFMFVFVSLAVSAIFAQDGKYEKAMVQMLQKMSTAGSPDQFSEISNGFARIAAAEEHKWQPYYNAAYTQLISGFMSFGTDMALAQGKVKQAMEYVDKMKSMVTDATVKSELNVLEAYCLIAKVSEDPMNNGAVYTGKIHELLDTAIALNKNNPRALYIKGMYIYNTPTFYGGGAGPAMPLLEGAQKLFAMPSPQSFVINWGADQNSELLVQAQSAK